ncbi:teichuronic acid biosynthesis protein TuaC [Niallia taxi]|uniref:Glycosyltransferase family 4 protein n=1 Tax=Niallia taxi TaxID=2499688 RepID=A0A3S2TUZ4_9BACI|nr:glycosyltransferase [Niallia taxi]MED4036610.1 glycosyltransferase [Niallia taxi]RVT58537.1 glycosyltransferase family 4 protein [Niallia taxi]
MKILWITSVYPSKEQPGNGVFHETQVQALKKLGLSITVICPTPQNHAVIRTLKKTYKRKSLPFFEVRNGVEVYRPIYTALPGQLRWAQPDKRIAKAVLETIQDKQIQFDMIHAHFAMPSGGAAHIVSRELEKPWLLTLHGSDVHVYPSFSRSANRAFQRSVHAADEVVAIGRNLAEAAQKKTGRKSIVLPIGINLSEFNYEEIPKEKVRKELQLPSDKKLITFIGRLVKEKGVYELADSLNRLPDDMAVVLVGDGPARDDLKKHEHYGKRLFLPGQISNDKVKDFLQASDIFALPSYSEGMPTVVIEAISMKVPVVCTAVGGVPDLFGEYSHLLIQPKSVDSIVERVMDYTSGKYDLSAIKGNLFKSVQDNFHVGRNAVILEERYRKLALGQSHLTKH